LGRSDSSSRNPSRPASRNAFDECVDALSSAETELALLRHESAKVRASSAASNVTAASYSYAAALGTSLSRSSTPDPQHIGRAPSPCPTPIGEGRAGASKKNVACPNSLNGMSLARSSSADLAAALSGMNLRTDGSVDTEKRLPLPIEQHGSDHHNYLFNIQNAQGHGNEHNYLKKSDAGHLHMPDVRQPAVRGNLGGSDVRNPQVERPKSAVNSSVSYARGSSPASLNGRLSPQYAHLDGTGSSFANYGLSGISLDSAMPSMIASQPGNFSLPPLLENVAAASPLGIPGLDSRIMAGGLPSGQGLNIAPESGRLGNQMAGNALQPSLADAMYLQYLRSAEYAAAAQVAALGGQSPEKYYMELLQKAYLGPVMSPQKQQFGAPLGNKSGVSNHAYCGNQAFGVGMGYPGSPFASAVVPNSSAGPGGPIRPNEFNMRFPATMRNLGGGAVGPWLMDGSLGSSLLEEFKSNKTKCFELSEIAGHVVEFRSAIFMTCFLIQDAK